LYVLEDIVSLGEEFDLRFFLAIALLLILFFLSHASHAQEKVVDSEVGIFLLLLGVEVVHL
jgi:hypothetical protein